MSDLGLPVWSELYHALNKAGFTPELIYGIINSKENKVAARLCEVASEMLESGEEYFYLIKFFKFVMPDDYEHSLMFLQNTGCAPSRQGWRNLEKKNFDTSEPLLPGREYVAQLYSIERTLESHRIKLFLEKQKPIRVGAPGLLWLLKMHGDKFYGDTIAVSFGLPTEDRQAVFTPTEDGNGKFGALPVERLGDESYLLIVKTA